MEDITPSFSNHISAQQRLSGAVEHLGNVLINRSFQSQDELLKEKQTPPTPSQKRGYLLPEFSTDSIGEMLGGPLYHGMNVANKFDTVSRTRSRLQSLLEKYIDSDHRSDKDEDGFVVPPPMSPSRSHHLVDHRLTHVLSKCRVWNYDDFRLRLQTFSSPINWFGKPDFLSPVECALHGWCNTDVSTIHCFHCKETLKHTSDSLQIDLDLPRTLLVDSHASQCGWRKSWCRRYFANVPHFDFPDKLFLDTSLDLLDLFGAVAKIDFQALERAGAQSAQEPARGGADVMQEVLMSVESELQREREAVEEVVREIVDSIGMMSEQSPLVANTTTSAPATTSSSSSSASSANGTLVEVELGSFRSSDDCDTPFLRHLLPPTTSHFSLQGPALSFLLLPAATLTSQSQSDVIAVNLIDLLVRFFDAFPATDAADLSRLLLLAVVCGWKHSSVPVPVSQIEHMSSTPVPSDTGHLVLQCPLCCQRLDVIDFCVQGKKLDLLAQHRYYCPFVSRQYFYDDVSTDATSTADNSRERDREVIVVGWQCRVQAINHYLEGKIGTSSPSTGTISTKRKRVFADLSQGNRDRDRGQGGAVTNTTSTTSVMTQQLSPENVYKKIRSVLYDALN